MKVLQCALLLLIVDLYECARILGFIPMPSYSHQVFFQPLWKELSLRGHQVTVLTTDPMDDPLLRNLTEINLRFSYKFLENNAGAQALDSVVDSQLSHVEVQKLIHDTSKGFDLVIAEYYFAAPLYFSRRFKCPYIGVLSYDGMNYMHRQIGNTAHSGIYPHPLLRVDRHPSLLQRICMVLMDFYHEFASGFLETQEIIAQKYFEDNTPVREVLQNVSALFLNSDPVFHRIRPLLPTVIPVGGSLARVTVKPLEMNIKKYLDDAHKGFIYFSLGSNVKSEHVPVRTLQVLLETFGELPYKILWKYEVSDLHKKPENVMIAKWVSQVEVLKHPNLKLFITHGGAQSIEEAIHARVPMVGMPFYVDQPHNVQSMVDLGIAVSIDYREISKTIFKEAILDVINNDRYRIRIKELADLVEDEPMTGLERAVWWTEYIIRHKGAAHLRSLDMPWYQYYLLDVTSVLVFTLITLTYLMVGALKVALGVLSRKIWVLRMNMS